MKAPRENGESAAGSRSVAQRAGAKHGRSAAVADAAVPLEEYPVQRVAAASATVQRVAQLQAVANRRSR